VFKNDHMNIRISLPVDVIVYVNDVTIIFNDNHVT